MQAEDQAGAGVGCRRCRRPSRRRVEESPSALQAAKTVKATPNWPRSRPATLRRLRQHAGDDDERGADDAGQVRRSAGPDALSQALGCRSRQWPPSSGVEVEERGDEQQHRCSDHHAVASSEGADVHFRSFVGLVSSVVVVAVTVSPSATRREARGSAPHA